MYKAVCLHAYHEHASLILIRNLIFQNQKPKKSLESDQTLSLVGGVWR